ncbi:MAG: hypothetical protein JXB24_06875 [Bacteroidales bacterium]|nr:hypothetical protein [Bacteroidales bacterium]
MIYENETFIVLTDKYRRTSNGLICLIISKEHKQNILELDEIDGKGLVFVLHVVFKVMERAYNSKGFRIWTAINHGSINSRNYFQRYIAPGLQIRASVGE